MMKEKTFEELIKEKTQRENFFMLTDVGEKFMVQLMQQVREATIEEVLKLADDNFFSKEPKGRLMENIENLPTDRIKVTDK